MDSPLVHLCVLVLMPTTLEFIFCVAPAAPLMQLCVLSFVQLWQSSMFLAGAISALGAAVVSNSYGRKATMTLGGLSLLHRRSHPAGRRPLRRLPCRQQNPPRRRHWRGQPGKLCMLHLELPRASGCTYTHSAGM